MVAAAGGLSAVLPVAATAPTLSGAQAPAYDRHRHEAG
jgi:hypothetical protein